MTVLCINSLVRLRAHYSEAKEYVLDGVYSTCSPSSILLKHVDLTDANEPPFTIKHRTMSATTYNYILRKGIVLVPLFIAMGVRTDKISIRQHRRGKNVHGNHTGKKKQANNVRSPRQDTKETSKHTIIKKARTGPPIISGWAS